MIETAAIDIFDQLPHASALCIPTNCSISSNGTNPMGALAGAFAKRWEELPAIYGGMLPYIPDVPVILGWVLQSDPLLLETHLKARDDKAARCALVAFPTMHQIGQPASLQLIIRSARLLAELADFNGWEEVYLGSPGTGVGGLKVEEVHPELTKILDNRFTVMRK
jgi:O-acetyl-ADP-ribose deacetylase (regulator of RNase III)